MYNHWVFISPHFDDVALSCGGLVWTLTQQGQRCEIWTILGGLPPDEDYSAFAQKNHADWGKTGREAISMRRAEDWAACAILGAEPRHFDWPDVIYRRDPANGAPLVNNNDELFGKPPEAELIHEIREKLEQALPQDGQLVMPMGLGDHIDHRLVVEVGKDITRPQHFYADYPYILKSFNKPVFSGQKWLPCPQPLSRAALTAWQDAVLCYGSQLSGFWRDEQETKLALNNYLAGGGGRLWKKADR